MQRALFNARVPVLGFVAYSGTGKTTLLKQIIPLLGEDGFRIGLIKRSHHRFEIDYPGKDSYELREAGANPVMICSSYRRATVTDFRPPRPSRLSDELRHFDQTGLNLVLVEGFKQESFPKIELHRPALGKPLLYPGDASIIAIATDEALNHTPRIPQLDLNDPARIAGYVRDWARSHDAR
jgi:molybdopterin-guanine dinucleotide biosynthesis protein B